jgi:hypothetical protein
MRFTIGRSADSYTIEHIYPQKNSLWLSDMEQWGDSTEKFQNALHTLGNLTVVTREHNSTVGNKPFAEKQSYPTVPGNAAPLSINNDWLRKDVSDWTPSRIDKRSYDLLNAALSYWKTPNV